MQFQEIAAVKTGSHNGNKTKLTLFNFTSTLKSHTKKVNHHSTVQNSSSTTFKTFVCIAKRQLFSVDDTY